VTGRFDRVDGRLDDLDARLSGRLDKIDATLDALARALAQIWRADKDQT
jgi:hypothetical protein